MRKAGGIITLIAGILGLITSLGTLLIGGIGTTLNANNGDNIVILGWVGILICFSIIVLGAIAMNAKTSTSGIFIIITSICGAYYGGTFVAVLMILALVGGLLACTGNDELERVEVPIEAPKSIMDSWIVFLCVFGLVFGGFIYLSDKPSTEAPISITLPDDTKLTAETPAVEPWESDEAAPPAEAAPPEVSLAADPAPPTETTTTDNTEPSTETLINDSATESLPPAEPAENPVKNMSFNDLYLDYNNLVGQKVKVEGYLMLFGDIASLTEKYGSAAVLYTDTSRLSRENRKLLLDNCSSGCNVEIEGVVGSVQFLKGITVTNLYKITTN